MSGRWCERGEDASEIVARKERMQVLLFYVGFGFGGFRDSRVDGEEIDSDSMIERWLLSEIDRSAQNLEVGGGPR